MEFYFVDGGELNSAVVERLWVFANNINSIAVHLCCDQSHWDEWIDGWTDGWLVCGH